MAEPAAPARPETTRTIAVPGNFVTVHRRRTDAIAACGAESPNFVDYEAVHSTMDRLCLRCFPNGYAD